MKAYATLKIILSFLILIVTAGMINDEFPLNEVIIVNSYRIVKSRSTHKTV
jgi:hypothetical protein